MELRHLRYFIVVAEELSFSRAAERLHVSQPPLSRQIQDLEAELKVQLLDRNRQGVQLTRAGRAVLARSRKLVRDAESLRVEAQRINKESQEELRVGYAPLPTAAIISKVLCRYHELSPGGRIALHDLTQTEMLSASLLPPSREIGCVSCRFFPGHTFWKWVCSIHRVDLART